jgi:uncharacterized protein YkwD
MQPIRSVVLAVALILAPAALAASPDAAWTGPTAEEQYFICLVNRARANPSAETKRMGIDLNEGLAAGTIASTPKQPLAPNARLTDAARGHVRWMLQQNTLGHEGARNSTPEKRMEAAGYAFKPPCGSGENIGFVGQTGDYAAAVNAVDELYRGLFLDSDVPDRGHRVNLLRPQFRETGVGLQQGPFRSDGTTFSSWLLTQDLAYNPGNSFLTGVVYSDTVKPDRFYTPGEGRGGITITAQRQGGSAKLTATTWSSGGYVLQLPPGVYRVTAAGGGLPAPLDGGTITIGAENVTVDLQIK